MFAALAKLLRIRTDQVDDALHSERAARLTLDRRGFLVAGAGAAGLLATGASFSFAPKALVEPLFQVDPATGIGVITGAPLRGPLTFSTFDMLLKEVYSEELVTFLTEPARRACRELSERFPKVAAEMRHEISRLKSHS